MNGRPVRPARPVGRLALASVAALSLTLTACAGGSAGPVDKLGDKPVTISIDWWGDANRAKATNEVIDAFEKKHPNITVKGQYKDWTGYWDALATTTAANDSPDVIQMDELYLASYANRGALYDVSQAGKLLDTSRFAEEALATGQVDGKQYALPIGVTALAIVVNTDLFKKYGVPLPDDKTWTWDDYTKIAEELTDKSGGKIRGASGTPGFDAGTLKYWARQEGGSVFDKDGTVTLKPEVLVGMWDFAMNLMSSGGGISASAMVEDQTAGLAGASLATRKSAMAPAYNTQITALRQASGANLKLLQMPHAGTAEANFFKPSMYWSVSSQTEHPAEAAAFVDFLLNTDAAADILRTERGIPANKDVLEHLSPSLSGTDKAAAEYSNAVTVGDAPVVTPNGASGIETMLQRYSQQVYFKKTSPEAAAKAFIKELQGEIDAAK
ncbi:ABC transporter substrate-binding protein [Streptomyces griseiscabiei]|uniref:Extracellular solute-binding protein n=1 Tax=Streptomyces griseiscabiei TaxID=2993540 RepID=A0ABU4L7V7_9ACTN|nr:extracellular solute-binding protein [Streptomyces griseiscabiei]MBZ3906234.1 extracellular solute-binding protein [Streptomyces griseiscabiei]MDX2911229.1 extracellular solute-binding protein [Streptomyces griseiscabiei]